MTTTAQDRLYRLLPEIYRTRDFDVGEPLRALLSLVQTQFDQIEADVAGLEDDWFIETCAEWVIPYIGELLASARLHPGSTDSFSLRGHVANTLSYRRRKGTAAVLEQLANDVTGWDSRAVEFFQRLTTTQHLNHLRFKRPATADLRDADNLEVIGGPFDPTTRTLEIRHLGGGGQFNIPNLGIYLWRIQAYPLESVAPKLVGEDLEARFYTVDPLGYDVVPSAADPTVERPLFRLFNLPRDETAIASLATEINVPEPLRRRPLYRELEHLRAEPDALPKTRYFDTPQVVRVLVDGDATAAVALTICDLSAWRSPPPLKTYPTPAGLLEYVIEAGIDPVLGRLAVRKDQIPESARLEVDYSYGYLGDLGGGPYPRHTSIERWLDPQRPIVWQLGVSADPALNSDPAGQVVATVAEAIAAWNLHVDTAPQTFGVICVLDSRSYQPTSILELHVPPGAQIAIVAADWPLTIDPDSPSGQSRPLGLLEPVGRRPHIKASIDVVTTPTVAIPDSNPGTAIFDGLLIEGDITVAGGSLGALHLNHCTLASKDGPDVGTVAVDFGAEEDTDNDALRISTYRSRIRTLLTGQSARLDVIESIVDAVGSEQLSGPAKMAIDAEFTDVHIEASSVRGTLIAKTLSASGSIFADQVAVLRRQVGCVRFSYLPITSEAPRRYRCQPNEALAARAAALGLPHAEALDPADRDRVLARVRPVFSALEPGHPAYFQLSPRCPLELTDGGEFDSEMGAFAFLRQPQRRANLTITSDEYAPFGRDVAGIEEWRRGDEG